MNLAYVWSCCPVLCPVLTLALNCWGAGSPKMVGCFGRGIRIRLYGKVEVGPWLLASVAQQRVALGLAGPPPSAPAGSTSNEEHYLIEQFMYNVTHCTEEQISILPIHWPGETRHGNWNTCTCICTRLINVNLERFCHSQDADARGRTQTEGWCLPPILFYFFALQQALNRSTGPHAYPSCPICEWASNDAL